MHIWEYTILSSMTVHAAVSIAVVYVSRSLYVFVCGMIWLSWRAQTLTHSLTSRLSINHRNLQPYYKQAVQSFPKLREIHEHSSTVVGKVTSGFLSDIKMSLQMRSTKSIAFDLCFEHDAVFGFGHTRGRVEGRVSIVKLQYQYCTFKKEAEDLKTRMTQQRECLKFLYSLLDTQLYGTSEGEPTH